MAIFGIYVRFLGCNAKKIYYLNLLLLKKNRLVSLQVAHDAEPSLDHTCNLNHNSEMEQTH